jgi:hypothetical protein
MSSHQSYVPVLVPGGSGIFAHLVIKLCGVRGNISQSSGTPSPQPPGPVQAMRAGRVFHSTLPVPGIRC